MNELDAPVERALGSPAVRYESRPGGYSTADRFRVSLGRRAKRLRQVRDRAASRRVAAPRARGLRVSSRAAFIPRLAGWDDDGTRPLLALEDLSEADWQVAWDARRVDAVRASLDELARSAPPPGTPTVREGFGELFGRWNVVADDPEPFLSTGLRPRDWLERRLPEILAAVESAPVDGDDLCHLDVRSDNLCFRDGRALLVDWNWLSRANADLDLAAWLPSLAVEGGPLPWEVLPGSGALAAFVAGVWAAVVGLPPPETAPTVRSLQRAQLAVALDWIDREL